MEVSMTKMASSYSWFWVNARGLGEHNPLRKLDATYPYRQGGGIPYLKYSCLDSCHTLPGGRIIGVVDSSKARDISAPCVVFHGIEGHTLRSEGLTRQRAERDGRRLRTGKVIASAARSTTGVYDAMLIGAEKTYIHLNASGYILAAA